MGGHSHWSTIKRHKGAVDAKRGKIFTKIIREITIASRAGGDPDANPTLRTCIAKAKEMNMPADTIKRAIQRGTGELPGVNYEEFTLEGYGPSGTGVLLEIATDNRNRTVAEIRNLFGKNNGNMAEAGAVAWQFQKKGLFIVEGSDIDEDQLLTLALEAGAEDVKETAGGFEITTELGEFEAVKEALQKANIETAVAEVTFLPQNLVKLDEKAAIQMLKLMEILDDQDDVQKVHANFDIPEEIMEKVAAAE
ncbi:YebC/PmpR family DNA-binding transcriptional regulator [Candidatus Nitronereus thalassa]|uniref:Probable transcriptional regulatory protein PPG34_09805 n=1 Tax=Candidatus Nitronereus thalassa TaxID=3020898 RepID=A0ABU3K8C6_9BACT|nr:YebC/PmpR family DNA-binding transcriptional regulator [Candidatus Nitronereus thalassa]MDT7042645.1 YebC/PmpR family DNA-binding transcriptional regulator [Candidatus Nitronereus thalassa]